MNLTDLIDVIIDSDLDVKEKDWLVRNLQHINQKFTEKFNHDVDI